LIASRRNTGALRALVVDAGEDLAAFSRDLYANGLRHRIFEEQGRQVVETLTDAEAATIVARYRAWRAGDLALTALPPVGARRTFAWRTVVASAPVVFATAALAIVCYPATWPIDANRLGVALPWLTATPVHIEGHALAFGTLRETCARLEVWRFVTPIFLHFSALHLGCNLAGLLAFGLRIERRFGSLATLALLLGTAVLSNVAQVLWQPDGLFGGLSGVDYGLFGFVFARGWREPGESAWAMPRSIAVVMIVGLVALSFGVTEPFGLAIANAAHWGGLAAGALIGVGWPRR